MRVGVEVAAGFDEEVFGEALVYRVVEDMDLGLDIVLDTELEILFGISFGYRRVTTLAGVFSDTSIEVIVIYEREHRPVRDGIGGFCIGQLADRFSCYGYKASE